MKLWITKSTALLSFFIASILTMNATEITDITNNEITENEKTERKGFRKLIPHYAKIQYAGAMGVVSAGGGWHYGGNDQWETDVMLGYLPKFSTSHDKMVITVRQNLIPWNVKLGERFNYRPMNVGMYLTYITGSEFWITQPSHMPDGYYSSYSTRIRLNVHLGQVIDFKLKDCFAESISLYYQVSSSDYYLLDVFSNKHLRPHQYLKLSFGLKLQFQ